MASLRRPNQPADKLPPFPLMQIDEICNCLAALGIQAQPDDFARPTPQAAQAIYAGLLDTLMGAPVDLLDQPRVAVMGMMEYKELYSDALQFTMFYKHVRHLAQTCGVDDFSMIDLTRPDAQRIKRVLSGMMNFAKFREERMQMREELQMRVQDSADKTEKLRRKLDNIERSIAEITAKNAADKPLTEEARRKNDVLRSELYDLRTQQVKLSHEVETVKTQKDSLYAQAQSKNTELTTVQSAVEASRRRIVQSPERIKRNITDMSTSVAAEKGILTNYQNKAREHTRRLEVIQVLEMDLKGLIDLAKGVENQRAKLEEAKRGKSILEAKLERQGMDATNLKSKIEQLERQSQNASDKLKRQDLMSREVRTRAAERIEALKAEYLVRSKERGMYQKEREKILAEQKGLDDEMAEFTARHEGELNELLAEYWGMRRQAEEYMNTMTDQLGLQLKAA